MVQCGCGAERDDYEGWMAHVRLGAPPVNRNKRISPKQRELDRAKLVDYMEKHRVVESNSSERKAIEL